MSPTRPSPTRPSRKLLLLLAFAVGGGLSHAGAAQDGAPIDLTGFYHGRWVDKVRNITNNVLRLHITQHGELVRGAALDNTLWLQGSLRGDRVILQWEHASGSYGDGFLNVIDGGRQLVGTWESKGSSRYYGIWELERL